MKTKITAILIFMLITSASMPVYYIYRSAYLERGYMELLATKNAALKPVAEKLNKNQSPDSEKLKKLFNELIARENSIAAIAVTDRMERLRFMVKNDSILSSGRIVDELVRDIKSGSFSAINEKTPAVKNYSGTDWLKDKLYIYRFASEGQSTIAVYSFTADRMTKIRLTLEVILIITCGLMATAGIIMLLGKTGILKEYERHIVRTIVIGEKSQKQAVIKKSDIKNGKDKSAPGTEAEKRKKIVKTAVQINESELSPLCESDDLHNEHSGMEKPGAKNDATDRLNHKIFSLFKKIHKKMSPESISLYIRMTENRLSKAYELRGKSLIRIDSLTFDSINISEIEKLNKPGTYITGSGDTVRVPLFDNGTITGIIEIKTGENASAVSLSIDQSEIADMASEISCFITGNNIITDRETGYYSSRYFTGMVAESIAEGKEFSLLMINIFSGVDADRKQRDMILKVMHPVLKKTAGAKNPVFLHKDCISLILRSPEKECESIEAALVKEISRFRLKISDDNIVKINPQSVLRCSADSRNLTNILQEVESLAAVDN